MKKVRLTEADLVRIVKRVLKEQEENELSEDYGAELSDEIKNAAKGLEGKTIKVLNKSGGGYTQFGIFEITKSSPNSNRDRLGLGLNLKRLTNESNSDVNDNTVYYLSGGCDGETFKFGKLSGSKGGSYVELDNKVPTARLAEHLSTEWCPLYTKKGTDF